MISLWWHPRRRWCCASDYIAHWYYEWKHCWQHVDAYKEHFNSWAASTEYSSFLSSQAATFLTMTWNSSFALNCIIVHIMLCDRAAGGCICCSISNAYGTIAVDVRLGLWCGEMGRGEKGEGRGDRLAVLTTIFYVRVYRTDHLPPPRKICYTHLVAYDVRELCWAKRTRIFWRRRCQREQLHNPHKIFQCILSNQNGK